MTLLNSLAVLYRVDNGFKKQITTVKCKNLSNNQHADSVSIIESHSCFLVILTQGRGTVRLNTDTPGCHLLYSQV